MFDHTHFEALGHLSLLPLSFPQSSRSFGRREKLPPIFHFHLPPKLNFKIEKQAYQLAAKG
jgi:hypothetical protein